MKYRCSHCNHSFELAERDFQRCPNCFWTTSLVSLEENIETAFSAREAETPHFSISNSKRRFPTRQLVIFLFICAGLWVIVGIIAVTKPSFPKFSFPSHIPVPQIVRQRMGDIAPGHSEKESDAAVMTFLTPEEKTRLMKPFQVTIPRQLTDDEEEILKKHVSLPKSIPEKPKLLAWSKDDFETMFEAEQKKRKVYLGWAYGRAVKKVFEKYYPSAVKAYEKGDFRLARDLFLQSLTFPIYRNNPVRHRAVALVILRPFINDVIGKIAVLNQHLAIQKLNADINSINQSYQELFSVLDLQEWEKASRAIADLRRRIEAFENQPSDGRLDESFFFGLLDPEIRTAIQIEAQPKPEAVADFKALLMDLNLKERVARQNTAEELLKVQKQCEEISRLLQEGNLEAAREKLREIQFPPELVEDVRARIALIDQAYALKGAKEEKKG